MTAATARLPVLVVDDDSALIHTLSDILRIHGYAPATAATAREGLRLAAEHPPALAVVDLRLPDMGGVELIAHLHALSEMTEVVVITGYASVDSAIEALRQHSIDYLLKPLQVDQLLSAVSVAGERWQRRHAEQRLQRSEERYRMFFDRNPQPMWVYDLESRRFLDVNDVATDRYGFSRSEFLGMTIADIRPPEDVSAMIAAVMSPTTEAARLWRHRKKNGEIIHVDVTTRDLDFEGRKARLVLAVDVSERVSAQHALEVRARQQEAVARFGQRALAADDVITLFGDATRLVAETLDAPFAGVLERHADGAHLVLRAGHGWPASAIGEFRTPISTHSQAGYSLLHRAPVVVPDYRADVRFPASAWLRDHGILSGMTVPIPGPVHPFGVLAVHDTQARGFTQDDVHFLQAIAHSVGAAVERSITDAALRQAQRLEAVGRLAGGIAHDFNNVLTAINGYGDMLRGSLREDDPRREDVEEILAASARASGLTKQLLAFSRRQVLQPAVLDLNDVVRDAEKMLQRLIGANIRLSTTLSPDLGKVLADAGQLGQVILNLCINARDAMPSGGSLTVETANVELRATSSREHSRAAQGAYVMLSVADTGTGMDAETQARIFEPFFTTKGPDHGTGLGLATVYGIVTQSGGEIRVHSELGRGTIFKVFLPRVDTGAAAGGSRPVA